jgi:hypothetical protein
MSIASVFEAPTVIAGLDNVAVIGDAIQQCASHLGIPERGGPLPEGWVGGDDDAGLGRKAYAILLPVPLNVFRDIQTYI